MKESLLLSYYEKQRVNEFEMPPTLEKGAVTVILSRYKQDVKLDAFNHYILASAKRSFAPHEALLHYVAAVKELRPLSSAL